MSRSPATASQVDGRAGAARQIEPENMSMWQTMESLRSIAVDVTSGLVTIGRGEQGNDSNEAKRYFGSLAAACSAKDPFAAYDACYAIQDLVHKRRIAINSEDHAARGRATHLRRYKLRLGQFVDELNGLDTQAKVLDQIAAFASDVARGSIRVDKGTVGDSSQFVRSQFRALLDACKAGNVGAAQGSFANIANQTRSQKVVLTQVGHDAQVAHRLDIRSGLRIRLDSLSAGITEVVEESVGTAEVAETA